MGNTISGTQENRQKRKQKDWAETIWELYKNNSWQRGFKKAKQQKKIKGSLYQLTLMERDWMS